MLSHVDCADASTMLGSFFQPISTGELLSSQAVSTSSGLPKPTLGTQPHVPAELQQLCLFLLAFLPSPSHSSHLSRNPAVPTVRQTSSKTSKRPPVNHPGTHLSVSPSITEPAPTVQGMTGGLPIFCHTQGSQPHQNRGPTQITYGMPLKYIALVTKIE